MLRDQTKILNLTSEELFTVKPVIANQKELEAEFSFVEKSISDESLLIDEKLIENINAQARKKEMVKFYFGIGYFVLFVAALISLFL